MKILKLFKSKFIFKTPKAKEVLILDYGTCYFNDLFLKNKANILKTRGEEYYLNILIISFFEWMGLKDKSLGQLYIINCIKYFKPKFLLSDLNGNVTEEHGEQSEQFVEMFQDFVQIMSMKQF